MRVASNATVWLRLCHMSFRVKRGYGADVSKTALGNAWVHGVDVLVAWMSLDSEDAALARRLNYRSVDDTFTPCASRLISYHHGITKPNHGLCPTDRTDDTAQLYPKTAQMQQTRSTTTTRLATIRRTRTALRVLVCGTTYHSETGRSEVESFIVKCFPKCFPICILNSLSVLFAVFVPENIRYTRYRCTGCSQCPAGYGNTGSACQDLRFYPFRLKRTYFCLLL